MDVVLQIGNYAAVAALVGLALLVPLYVSQTRDLHRLRRWAALTADLAEAEREAAEAARAESARAEGDRPGRRRAVPVVHGRRATMPTQARPAARVHPGPRAESSAPRPMSPAERIALDRPATTRITAERARVHTPPQGKPATSGLTPRRLAALVGGVVALGIAVIAVALEVSHPGSEREDAPRSAAVEPSEVEVAVLNGTAVPGLAAKVGDDVEANEFELGTVTNSETPYENTTVVYAAGAQREAQAVATALGAARVRPMDAEIRALAQGADVAVIAGEDRNAS